MQTVRLLAVAGSARREALSRRLLAAFVRSAEAAGAEVTFADVDALGAMPLYHGDLEDERGLPPAAADLQRLLAVHDGLLVATPEYNGFFPPLIKNAFDWLSRPLPDGSGKPGTIHARGKPAGIVASSPGALGGIRALPLLRQYLSNLGFIVVPEQLALGAADKAFDADGGLADPAKCATLTHVAGAVVRLAGRLKD